MAIAPSHGHVQVHCVVNLNHFSLCMKPFLLLSSIFHCLLSVQAQQHLPLLQMTDLEYLGAFRLPADAFGSSELNFSEGPLAFNPVNNSLFIVGHTHHQAVAEFSIPTPSLAPMPLLPMATNLQPFRPLLQTSTCGNPDELDRIGGMANSGSTPTSTTMPMPPAH